MQTINLEDTILYYKPTCPFCIRVLNFMGENNIECETRTTYDAVNMTDLTALTGKSQVPCLVIKGVPMLESSDIIDYMHEKVEAFYN